MATKRATRKKTAKKIAAKAINQFIYKGVKQVGDALLWRDSGPDRNIEGYYRLVFVPPNMVGPGDIVDDLDPKKRYTFYLFEPEGNAQSARELDRMRRAGFIKCEAGEGKRFISATDKFEARDGVLVFGSSIWYAVPIERAKGNRAPQIEGVLHIAEAHADLADSARAEGFERVTASTRGDGLGQRT